MFSGHRVRVSRDVQKCTILLFHDCTTCQRIFEPIRVATGIIDKVIENKENEVEFDDYYMKYATQLRRVDVHMNREHKKLKLSKQDYGSKFLVAEISMLECLEDWFSTDVLNSCLTYLNLAG